MPKFKVIITEVVKETREVECEAASALDAAAIVAYRYLDSVDPRVPDTVSVESRDYEVTGDGRTYQFADHHFEDDRADSPRRG